MASSDQRLRSYPESVQIKVFQKSKPGAIYAWEAACLSFSLLPLAMVFANRSSPLVLSVSTFCVAIALTLEGGWQVFGKKTLRVLSDPLGLLVLAIILWGLLSVSWSDAPSISLETISEISLAIFLVTFLAINLPDQLRLRHLQIVIFSVLFGCVIIVFNYTTGFSYWHLFNKKLQGYIFNRTIITLVLLSIPVLAGWKAFSGKETTSQKHMAIMVFGSLFLLFAVILFADSGGAVLGVVVGCLAYGAFRFFPRITAGFSGIGLVLFLLAAPLTGPVMERVMPETVLQMLSSAHARERIEIWHIFGQATLERPVMGAGIGASPVAAFSETAKKLSLNQKQLEALNMGHPHDLALQIWYELGFVGAVLLLLIILLCLLYLVRSSMPAKAMKFAFFAMVAAISVMTHGAWQTWWSTVIGAGLIWFLAINHRDASHAGSGP